ncbi:Ovule protein [Sphingobacterium prati]
MFNAKSMPKNTAYSLKPKAFVFSQFSGGQIYHLLFLCIEKVSQSSALIICLLFLLNEVTFGFLN